MLLAVYERTVSAWRSVQPARRVGACPLPAPNGVYRNCIDGSPVEIYEEQLAVGGEPIVLSL
ncbi:MAG: hypothetical protein ACLTZF_08940 [Oscillospiraceae bacterium]